MKETQFVHQRQADWEAWDRWLGIRMPEASKATRKSPAARIRKEPQAASAIPVDALPKAFRQLCQDLSLARDRHYSGVLVHALHERVLAAHQRIYGARPRQAGQWRAFVATGLPQLVRRESRFVLAAAALFFLPLLIVMFNVQWTPDNVYFLLSPEVAGRYEEMYAPDAVRIGRPRAASTDLTMLAFYIANNVRIDFQCFAGGIAFGLGSIFFLVYNGLMIGATAGHLTVLGYVETFWGFVAGHSAPELIGAVLSGAAGLKIGFALVAPGRLSRIEALKRVANDAVRLLYGAAGLTFIAAFIEALWSPLRFLPFELKIAVGIAVWCILLAYFLFAGRAPRAA